MFQKQLYILNVHYVYKNKSTGYVSKQLLHGLQYW